MKKYLKALNKMKEDKTIDEIISEIGISEEDIENKEIAELDKNELDVDDETAIATELLKTVNDDRAMADKIFQLFYPEIGSGADKSQASKEALTKALELKIEAAKNIIELLKVKQKAKQSKASLGFFFGDTVSPKKAGINLGSLVNEFDDED
jgi:GH24 family phage-related lysozyme (muramidase)